MNSISIMFGALVSNDVKDANVHEDDVNVEELIIFDTTLRDGEQSPGVTLTLKEKLEIARQLSRLGVTVCEAGFPIASQGDFEAVRRVANDIGPLMEGRESLNPMVICALARARKADIDSAFEAIKGAPRHRIHTFLATSDIHLQYKLKISREQCIDQVREMVSYAKSLCDDVEFSPEDAGRSDRHFLYDVLTVAIEAGATTLNIPDTVGYNFPDEYGSLIKNLIDNTKGAENVVFSTHCHNDLGLATANTLSGIINGARQVEVTINGVGERAGNTSLEELVMAVSTHAKDCPVYTMINTTEIMRTSRMVSTYMGMVVQPNKAIVGANAFAHESGIHQDGMLKHKDTYEIMRPEAVGIETACNLVLGKHSGRHAFKQHLETLGYNALTDSTLNIIFQRFKELADNKKRIDSADIHALVQDELQLCESGPPKWRLKGIQISCGDLCSATASVSLIDVNGKESQEESGGSGPVNAMCGAINRIVLLHEITLAEYHVQSISGGTDALGNVSVRIHYRYNNTCKPAEFTGHGTHDDILVASARAYLSAINRLISSGITTGMMPQIKSIDI